MGIYLPDMEMPTSCEKCPFLDYEEGFCFASGVKGKSGWYESKLCPGGIKDERHADCPLVPVPPHGRLIEEADAIKTVWMILNGLGYLKEENPQLEQTVREVFATAPTIEVE